MKENHVLCLFKDRRNNQICTNENGSCFSLLIVSLVVSGCRHLSHHYSSYFFCFLYICIYEPSSFCQNFFPVGFPSPVHRTTWL